MSDIDIPAAIMLILLIGVWIVVTIGAVLVVHFLLTLPLRRAERARMFLDVLDLGWQQGRRPEETVLSLADSRDLSMGPYFHLLAAWLRTSLPLAGALSKTPQFLPPQVNAMLQAGQKIGDLKKVLPACRQLLKDAVSQTRSALNYLVVLTFVITPLGMWVTLVLKIKILPKIMEISHGIGVGTVISGVIFVSEHAVTWIICQAVLLFVLWLGVLAYIAGPRLAVWLPALQRFHFSLPWRRKRLYRDFSTMLAILLDSGMPEPESVALAADCTSNSVLRRRAARVIERLKEGQKLSQAVHAMDDSGEFGWRLKNAFQAGGGFFQALAGWQESLDARAFQEEQTVAQGVSTALVFWSGLWVGTVAISFFVFLISIIDAGILW